MQSPCLYHHAAGEKHNMIDTIEGCCLSDNPISEKRDRHEDADDDARDAKRQRIDSATSLDNSHSSSPSKPTSSVTGESSSHSSKISVSTRLVQLPQVILTTYGVPRSEHPQHHEICILCRGKFVGCGTKAKLPCGHLYHARCIRKLFVRCTKDEMLFPQAAAQLLCHFHSASNSYQSKNGRRLKKPRLN